MPLFHYRVHDKQATVQIERAGDAYQVTIDDRHYTISLHKQEEHLIAFRANGQRQQVAIAPGPTAGERHLWLNGDSWLLEKLDPRKHRRASSVEDASGVLTASMPGQVQEVLIAEGDSVLKGDPLILLEAMKMEMRIAAPTDGVVKAVHCTVGDVVERGQALVVVDQG